MQFILHIKNKAQAPLGAISQSTAVFVPVSKRMVKAAKGKPTSLALSSIPVEYNGRGAAWPHPQGVVTRAIVNPKSGTFNHPSFRYGWGPAPLASSTLLETGEKRVLKRGASSFSSRYKTKLLLHPWRMDFIAPLGGLNPRVLESRVRLPRKGWEHTERSSVFGAPVSERMGTKIQNLPSLPLSSTGMEGWERPIIICIDGLISSGKSTLLKGLQKKGFKTYPEPLHKWKTQLEKFYENPKKEFLNTQCLILDSQTRLKEKIMENIDAYTEGPKYIFIERNSISQLYFVYTGLDLDNISVREARFFFNSWKDLVWLPDVIVHMNASASTCFNRLQSRKQVGDGGITLNYLELLDKNYMGIYEQVSKNPFYRCIDLCEKESPNLCIEKVLREIKEIRAPR